MRYITLTEELKQNIFKEFQEKLTTERFSKNKINFTFDLNNKTTTTDKVILNIRAEAWLKMWSLVNSESGEIGWHGLVNKLADNVFEITDILVYPQYVTGVTVQTDDVEYGNWLHKDISDETINNLRFHGHSHVNMGTSPSGVDLAWYNDILQGLNENDFYIFAILNKKNDMFLEIYDLNTNTIYEKNDITVNVILEDNNYLQNWVTRTKQEMLKQRTYKFESLKPYGTTTKDPSNKNEIIDIILATTVEDLIADKEYAKMIEKELDAIAASEYYFGKGWLAWHETTIEEKLTLAQEQWTPKGLTVSKSKTTKKATPKTYKEYKEKWGGYYD